MDHEAIKNRVTTLDAFLKEFNELSRPEHPLELPETTSDQEILTDLDGVGEIIEKIFRTPADGRIFLPVEQLSNEPSIYKREVYIKELARIEFYYTRALPLTHPDFNIIGCLIPKDKDAYEDVFADSEHTVATLINLTGQPIPKEDYLAKKYGAQVADTLETLTEISECLFKD